MPIFLSEKSEATPTQLQIRDIIKTRNSLSYLRLEHDASKVKHRYINIYITVRREVNVLVVYQAIKFNRKQAIK